jgi:hypothetical protein
MRFAAATLLVVLGSVVSAGAQTFATVHLDGMPTLWVTDRAGAETKGKLVKWTDTAIVVQGEQGQRTFDVGEVALVERRDGLKNGALIGAAIGLVAGVVVGGFQDCGSDCTGVRIAAGLTNMAIYAAIGAGIDALIPGRRRLWPARP